MSNQAKEPMAWPPSNLLQYLPAIYHEDPFLGQFLLAFEKLLLGRDDGVQLEGETSGALEETVAHMATHFIPSETPESFLPWLASWTAFSLRFDLEVWQQRDFISDILDLYRRRGTKENLVKLLKIFTKGVPEVTETDDADKPHYFEVTVILPRYEVAMLQRQVAIAEALVELEKPAHTRSKLTPVFPSMQINERLQVGVNTLLGTVPRPEE